MAKNDEFFLAGSTGRNLSVSGKPGRLEQILQSTEIGGYIRTKIQQTKIAVTKI